MKKLLLLLILLVCASIFFLQNRLQLEKLYLEHTNNIFNKLPQQVKQVIPQPPPKKPPFKDNEIFEFSYNMGPLKAGSAKLVFLGEAEFNGQKAYHITFESRVAAFYDLEDIHAYPETFYPINIKRKIKNFGIASNIEECYDQENFKVEITKDGILRKKTTVIKKQNPIQNALLLVYFCRTLSESRLSSGFEKQVSLPVSDFKVIYRKKEKIETPAGEFEAFVFESEPEKMRFWMSTDKKRIPLKLENLTAIGPSSITLSKLPE